MKHLLPLAALMLPLIATAKPVEPQRAATIAAHVLKADVRQQPLPESIQGMYLYVSESGFAVIAADDRIRPVLAYSTHDTFAKEIPASVADWLSGYSDEIAMLQKCGIEASSWTNAEWARLEATPGEGELFTTVISPLVPVQWDQDPLYNNLCPYNTQYNSRTVAGCVATATAQLMRYWNHPAQGTGSHSYTLSTYGTLSADFGNTTYQWSLMPASLTSVSSTAEVQAVATLIYHVGVAVEMNYGVGGSSASTNAFGSLTSTCAENALKTYFGYTHTARTATKSSMSDSAWCDLMESELLASRPVLYSGRDVSGGHSFLLDGMNASGQFHVNWGWGGYCDGYYTIGGLNPSSSGTGGSASSTYNLSNAAVVGIQPSGATGGNYSITATTVANCTVTGTGSYAWLDTATIIANTDNGYRFARWSDGETANPRYIVVDSNLTFTPMLENVSEGDVLYYGAGTEAISYFGVGNNTYCWGVRFGTDDLAGRNSIVAVQYMDDFLSYSASTSSISAQLRIYSGGNNAPGTMIYNQTVTIGETGQLKQVMLDSSVTIDPNQPLWLTMRCTEGGWPAATGTYCGNPNASWSSTNDGQYWSPMTTYGNYYSWMLRAVMAIDTASPAPQPEGNTVSLLATAGGFTAGSGTYSYGHSATLWAFADDDYRFAGWSDGEQANPRYLIVTGDTTITALFEQVVGDTLWYVHPSTANLVIGSFQSDSIYVWGIRLEPSSLEGHGRIVAVNTLSGQPGIYNLDIYQGTTPSSLIYSHPFPVAQEAFEPISLEPSTTVNIDPSKPLWVLLRTQGLTHPAAIGNYAGNNNSCYSSYGGTNLTPLTSQNRNNSWAMAVVLGDACPAGLSSYTTVDTTATSYTWNGTTYTQSGVYNYVTQNANGCDSTAVLHLTLRGTTGIADADGIEVNIAPNPTTGVVTVECEGLNSIEVYSADGRLQMRSDIATLDMTDLPAGLYTMRLQTAHGVAVRRLVKQ